MAEFIEQCRRMITIESTPTEGSKKVGEFAAQLCREAGLHVDMQTSVHQNVEQVNVIARLTKERPEMEFLLQTHLDTNDPGPFGLWNETGFNPFDATIVDGKIYGLGSANTKLDFICKLEAMKKFVGKNNFKLAPVLVGTFGEEIGMAGMLKLIRQNKISPRMALVGEPTNLEVVNAAKGYVTVEIRIPLSEEEIAYRKDHDLDESTSTQSKLFSGKPAHSSTPDLGDSAILKMLDFVMTLNDQTTIYEIDGGVTFNTIPSHAMLEIDAKPRFQQPVVHKIKLIYQALKKLEAAFQSKRDEKFNPPFPTLNIGLIRTFSDHVLMAGSCRLPPCVTQMDYDLWMRDLQTATQAAGAQFKITDYKRSFYTPENSILVRGCLAELEKVGRAPTLTTQPSINEATLLTRIGCECVSFGPGLREGNAHTPTEHVLIEDLKTATQFYEGIIERFCL